MKPAYRDIRDRIDEKPLWYDVYGVPRYDEPEIPKRLMGVIACQKCNMRFLVSMVHEIYQSQKKDYLEEDLETKKYKLKDCWHYGDPPQHDCVGDTMSSISIVRYDKLEDDFQNYKW